jgi:hypothetical protein
MVVAGVVRRQRVVPRNPKQFIHDCLPTSGHLSLSHAKVGANTDQWHCRPRETQHMINPWK